MERQSGRVKERIKQSAKAGKLKPEDDHELFQLKANAGAATDPRLLYSDATPGSSGPVWLPRDGLGGLMSSEAGRVWLPCHG